MNDGQCLDKNKSKKTDLKKNFVLKIYFIVQLMKDKKNEKSLLEIIQNRISTSLKKDDKTVEEEYTIDLQIKEENLKIGGD